MRNSGLVQSIITRTNIFGVGKSFDHMEHLSGNKRRNYSIAEFLSGMKIVIGETFRGCKVISIEASDNSNDVEVVLAKSYKSDPTNFKLKTMLFKRKNFASLKFAK